MHSNIDIRAMQHSDITEMQLCSSAQYGQITRQPLKLAIAGLSRSTSTYIDLWNGQSISDPLNLQCTMHNALGSKAIYSRLGFAHATAPGVSSSRMSVVITGCHTSKQPDLP